MKKKNVDISIIIPYFRKKKYFHQSIKSVLNQTFKKYEIIIIYDDENKGDLKFISDIKEEIIDFQPDIIMHLAWEGIPDLSKIVCTENLYMAINFFDQVLDNTNCKKVIVSGSCIEYGNRQGQCKESDQVVINTYFAWAKYALYLYLSIRCTKIYCKMVTE